MHLEHVNLTVSNVDAAVDFYRRLLGLEVRWRGATTNGRPAAHVGTDRCYIALFEGTGGPVEGGDYERVGVNHFGFVVDDIDATRRQLASLGITPTAEADYEPGQRFYFRDLDGIEVEIVQYGEVVGHD